MDLDLTHPSVDDLRTRAKKRIPKFIFEYLDSGTGRELGLKINRTSLDRVGFWPSILKGKIETKMQTSFMGQN